MSAGDGRREEVIAVVAAMIRDVIQEEWVRELAIGPETSFAHDIQAKSIEIVVLAGRLHEHYGDELDLIGWLSGLEPEVVAELRVGELADYIASRVG